MSRNTSSLRPLPDSPGASLRQRLLLAVLILAFATGAAYGALILATRVDHILFPGREISIGCPGCDKDGESGPTKRINVLVMGLDRRPREGDAPARTDTMMVLTIDPQTKTAGALGIPRDFYVEIPDEDGGYFEERINTAFVYGELDDYPGGGAKLAIDTVEHNLGIKIDHYIIIDFEGFQEVIDDLGGIDIDVPEYVYDPCYSETELPGDCWYLEFEPGMQHMDGRTALGYARIRYSSNDLDRIQRQQRVIFAVMDKSLGLHVLTNALDLWKKYKHAIVTDINDFEVSGYAMLAADIEQDRISALSLGPCAVPWTTAAGAEVLLPSREGCGRIVEALFSDQQLTEENATVEIRDGTVSEIAEDTKTLLANLGLPEGSLIVSEPPTEDVLKTEIVYYSEASYTAGKIAEWLGVPGIARSATPADAELRTTEAGVVVILGPDADITGLTSDSTDSDSTQ